MSRGINRDSIFTDIRDREHFLELLEAAVERYRVRLHAYVLMDNHFHLLVETPEANLSACMQWLKQAYSMWYNVRHERVGPLFQGRYRDVPVEDASWIYELSLYLHLNPLRLARFKLSKVQRQSENLGMGQPLSRQEATRRLRELRAYRWSSYRAYAGYVPAPRWLTLQAILERAGGRDRRRTYRKAVMGRLTGGEEGDALERVRDVLAVGSESFRERIRGLMKNAGREIAGHGEDGDAVPLETVIGAVEQVLGEPVRREKRGGFGRNIVLKIARDVSGLTLKELGERMGKLDYVTVHTTIRRVETKMAIDPKLQGLIDKVKRVIRKKKT